MTDVSRRGFLGSSMAAAAGVAGLGLAGAAALPASIEAAAGGEELSGWGVVAHVRDASTGEIAVFDGERETVVRDRALASRLLRAAQ